MEDLFKLVRVQIIIVGLYFVCKLMRVQFLYTDSPELLKTFLLSFPNFCEGVVGVLILTAIGLYLNQKTKFNNPTIYITATILASIYVITQEFKIHDLGGRNIYDPNDVVFSIIGLLVGLGIVFKISPEIKRNAT